ncbi:MAG TPA: VWA domain-containing protein [Vicinamibacterales bacterium]|nr:VWA domain-containing protein [Vicinamibacterales bacterium]
MRTASWLSLSAIGFLSAILAAQQPAAPAPGAQRPAAGQQPPLTYKVEVNYVEVDATVTDAQGNFVRGLNQNDFQVSEDGKPQSLSIFSLVDIPVEHADPPLFAKNAIPPDVATNKHPAEGRLFVLLLDDLHTGFGRSALLRKAATLFVDRYVGANDEVAVVTTGGAAKGSQEFTTNRALILDAISRFAGQKAQSQTLAGIDDALANEDYAAGKSPNTNAETRMNDIERGTKARNALDTVKNVADYLAGIRGRRKALVYFSEGIDYDISNLISSDTNAYASDVLQSTRDAIAAATRANVSIYGIDPRGLTNMGDELMQIGSLPSGDQSLGITSLQNELRRSQDSLRVLSDQTGGFAVVNANDFHNAFARILQDNSSYYVLGYYPATEKHDGRFHRISVRVDRPGLTVRARQGYVAPKGKEQPRKILGGSTTSVELREALTSPVAVSGLPLRAFAAPFRGEAPNASVAIALEVDPAQMKFTEQNGLYTDKLEVSLFAADVSGKIRDGGRDEVALALHQGTYQAIEQSHGLRVMHTLALPPGKYQLRIGARDGNSGAVGTVLYDLQVPDFSKGDLTMSGIAITSASASRIPTAQPDPLFKDVLPASPTTIRDFPRGDSIAVFAEVYDNAVSTPHRVSIAATVLADDGKTVFSASDERSSAELQGARGGYGYTATIPTAALAPGRYVLRIDAKSLAKASATASREVEFRVR